MIVYLIISTNKPLLDVNTHGMEMFGKLLLNAEQKRTSILILVMLIMALV